MSQIKNGGLDQYGKVKINCLNGIGCERVNVQVVTKNIMTFIHHDGRNTVQ